VRDFWLDSGFLLAVDQANMGLMETDWAENRAKIPQDFIRSTLGKVFDSLYSTGERDKFRTRIERSASGGTDIYITHRGMEEVYTTARKDNTIWQPRPRDPELEAEFLRRLMVKLGVSQEESRTLQAQAEASQGAPAPKAAVVDVGAAPAVQLDEDFDRAWRRVGLALDRTGFTVEDRDRSKGVYFVRYIDPTLEKQEPGFFGKLFGRGSAPLPTSQYQIQVRGQDGRSLVSVQDSKGSAAPTADAQRITQVLADELK
jgi:outer membrane protein assembly factor BamC